MKQTIPTFLLAAACLLLLLAVVLFIYGVSDLNRTLDILASDPAASGIDYMGLGWGAGISLLAVSLPGLILAVIASRSHTRRLLRRISAATAAIHALLTALSVFLFYY